MQNQPETEQFRKERSENMHTMTDLQLTDRYTQELQKLKALTRYGRHSERFLGYPNTRMLNRCRRELEGRGLPVPPVNPPEKEEDTETSKATREVSESPARKDTNP